MKKKILLPRDSKSDSSPGGGLGGRITGPKKKLISRYRNPKDKPAVRSSDSLPPVLDRWTTCPTCGERVKEKNFEKHRKKAHKKVLTKSERLAEENKRTKGKRRTSAFASDRERSTDLMDQPYVVSGGGFGVGKGKKR